MRAVDYIIVGDGYAALFFAHQLIKSGKEFVLYSEGKKGASQVSAGIINPVVLKKFTTFWLAQEQIDSLKETLTEIALYTGQNYLIEEAIHRIFHDEKERELWIKKAQSEDLSPFLNIDFKFLDKVHNPFGAGKVNHSARLDVDRFFADMLVYLKEQGHLMAERFDYNKLDAAKSTYASLVYGNLVFCEGMGVVKNPYFSEIQVVPNKGHHLKVRLAIALSNSYTLKKKHFLFPINSESYYYGGTYDRHQLEDGTDDSAREELVKGLEELYPHSFEVEEVNFGFRPTVKDRRPILGNNIVYPNLYVFNGLGARGILNGNFFAKSLINHIEAGVPLPEEVNLKRFQP